MKYTISEARFKEIIKESIEEGIADAIKSGLWKAKNVYTQSNDVKRQNAKPYNPYTYLMNKNIINNIIKEEINKYIKAYHTSNATFDNFDLGYVNSGNKNQAYGYGIYVSLSEKGAENYGKIKCIVEIPSNNKLYLNDFNSLSIKYINKVKNILYNYILQHDEDEMYKGCEEEFMQELNTSFQPMNGLSLYGTISTYLGSDKKASEFCYKFLKK